MAKGTRKPNSGHANMLCGTKTRVFVHAGTHACTVHLSAQPLTPLLKPHVCCCRWGFFQKVHAPFTFHVVCTNTHARCNTFPQLLLASDSLTSFSQVGLSSSPKEKRTVCPFLTRVLAPVAYIQYKAHITTTHMFADMD